MAKREHQPFKVENGMMVCKLGCRCICCQLEQGADDIRNGEGGSTYSENVYLSNSELSALQYQEREPEDDSDPPDVDDNVVVHDPRNVMHKGRVVKDKREFRKFGEQPMEKKK